MKISSESEPPRLSKSSFFGAALQNCLPIVKMKLSDMSFRGADRSPLRRFQKAAFGIGLAIGMSLMVVPASAVTIVGGNGLLTTAGGTQLETWLGEGNLTLNNIWAHTPGDGQFSTDFHKAANAKGRTFNIIEVLLNGQQFGVIGGYNPRDWHSNVDYNYSPTLAERTAFIFNLSTGTRLDQRSDGAGYYQTYNSYNNGPTFGDGRPDIDVGFDLTRGSVDHYSYGPGTYGVGLNVLGSPGRLIINGALRYGRMETFTIAPGAVPETSSTVVLLLIGLGVCAFARRNGVITAK